jgi:hypothetical protein
MDSIVLVIPMTLEKMTMNVSKHHMVLNASVSGSRKNNVANNLVLIVMMITAKNHILMSVPV